MCKRMLAVLSIALLPAAGYALTGYSQHFEGFSPDDPSALASDGWLVYGNVFSPGGAYLYGYGPYPAPNHNVAFCQIVTGEGGDEQGAQQLVVFSDYNNADHANGNRIESNVYREQTIAAGDAGTSWRFAFQAKRGNLEGGSTALAFIKTLDPNAGYAMTNFITVDMTAIPQTWGGYQVSITIDAALVGQLLQIGFASTATHYEGSAIFYDNLLFEPAGDVGVPGLEAIAGATLGQNAPNPFNPVTRVPFTLTSAGRVDLAVYDLAGRRVATLEQGHLPAGEHQAAWNGTADSGRAVASGQYRCVLTTATGRVSRGMVLVK